MAQKKMGQICNSFIQPLRWHYQKLVFFMTSLKYLAICVRTYAGRVLYYLYAISLRKHLESDDQSANLVTNWMLESNFSSEEFEDYRQALSMFNNISKDGTQVILYEIKKNPVDGSTVKKTPLLNSKKTKTKSTPFKRITYRKSGDKSDDYPKKKNKFKDLKVRIFLLIIVLLTFITIMFFMNSIGGESSDVKTVQQFILFRIDNPSYFLHL